MEEPVAPPPEIVQAIKDVVAAAPELFCGPSAPDVLSCAAHDLEKYAHFSGQAPWRRGIQGLGYTVADTNGGTLLGSTCNSRECDGTVSHIADAAWIAAMSPAAAPHLALWLRATAERWRTAIDRAASIEGADPSTWLTEVDEAALAVARLVLESGI